MPYCLQPASDVETDMKRIAREQVARAVEELEDDALEHHETVHQVRKRCKKLRGLTRLVRPVFSGYREENEFFRDAARELSYVRDAQSIVESFDSLRRYFGKQIAPDIFAAVRSELVKRRQQVAEDHQRIAEKLDVFRAKMHESHDRIEGWKIAAPGFDALEGGLTKTYKRGRAGWSTAYEQKTSDSFHEWRKRVKYHWYHLRLLKAVWPKMLAVQMKTADKLADRLGDEHDLVVLRETFAQEQWLSAGDRERQLLCALIGARRRDLQQQAYSLGAYLFAEKPMHLRNRLQSYWRIRWQEPAE